MKRILSLNKRLVVILLIVFCVVFAVISALRVYENDKQGENSHFPNYCFQESWSCCSFAWTNDTFYSLRGIWSESPPSFAPNGYELRKTDLTTCEDEVLINYIKGENIYLLANDSDVYIAKMEVIYEKDMYGWEKPVLNYIDLFSLEGIKENKVMWHIEKEADAFFNGWLLNNNILYITTTNEILLFDIKTGIEKVLYTSTDGIQSGYYGEKLLMQGGRLFFVEGNIVSYINVKTKEVKNLAEISAILPPHDTSSSHKYWVYNSELYYWDEAKRATVKMHIETGEITIVSESRLYFGQANEYGIIVCEIPKENVDKYSSTNRTIMEYAPSVSNDYFYVYNLDGELDIKEQNRRSLEAESPVLIGNKYFSYFYFHHKNGELEKSDIKLLPVQMR